MLTHPRIPSLPRTVRNFALVRYEDLHANPGTMHDKLQTALSPQ
jgi:hypothetical protein